MSFWEKRKTKKIESLQEDLIEILGAEKAGYENKKDWEYFAQKLGFDKNDERWFINAQKPFFSLVSLLWAREVPMCVDEERRCWYPTSWKDAEPCLYEFKYLMKIANKQRRIEVLQRLPKSINRLPEPERLEAVRQFIEKEVGNPLKIEVDCSNFVASMKLKFGEPDTSLSVLQEETEND